MSRNQPGGGPRVRELDHPALQLMHALYRVLLGVTIGGVATFLLIVLAGVVLQEQGLAFVFGLRLDVNEMLRATMLPVAIFGGVLLAAWPGVLAGRDAAMFAAGEVFARQHPTDVPPRKARLALTSTPASSLEAAGGLMAIAYGIALVIGGIVVLNERPSVGGAVYLLITIVATVVGVVMLIVGRRMKPVQEPRIEALDKRWENRAERADRAEKHARQGFARADPPRILQRSDVARIVFGLAQAVAFLGLLIFIAAVLMRQPCRYCEPRRFGPFGERIIDIVNGAGGAVLVTAGLICVVLWLCTLGYAFARERTLKRWLQQVGHVKVRDRLQRSELLEVPSAATRLAQTLAAFGTSLLIIAGGVEVVGAEGLDGSPALAVGQGMLLVAVVVGLLAYRRELNLRMLVRDRVRPGDALDAEDLE